MFIQSRPKVKKGRSYKTKFIQKVKEGKKEEIAEAEPISI